MMEIHIGMSHGRAASSHECILILFSPGQNGPESEKREDMTKVDLTTIL
jgi:hypothetical protein